MIYIQTSIKDNTQRLEAWAKVTGEAKYCEDLPTADYLTARLLTSPHAHALIESIDISKAAALPGVKAVITGRDFPFNSGALIQDRPPLAWEKVRYAGEAVAMVVAVDEAAAAAALPAIEVSYQPLPFVLTPCQALLPEAPLLHENLELYKRAAGNVYPQAGSNIASLYSIRKGHAKTVLSQCEFVVEQSYYLPPSDHLAMEIRAAQARISPDGEVSITSSTQAPYSVQEQLAMYFNIPVGKVRVQTSYVGGAFGGKVSVVLELLAYMASKAVGGRPVRVVLTREQDITAAPCRLGLEANIRLGATKEGLLQAAELCYRLDCGAYADISPNMTMAIAANGSGPYNIENLCCDAYCVYTNHTFATSYRGFGHESYLFCIERTLDKLARACNIDPWDIRLLNAIQPGHLTPTQVTCTLSNTGNLSACLNKLKSLSNWDEGSRIQLDERTVRAKGVACLWKAANPPTNAVSGALLTFNTDGSVNLNTGVIEMGNGSQTKLAQILADKLRMDISMVHVAMGVDTRLQPKHWKTVASISEYMAGHAVMRAAEDALAQIRSIAAQALNCIPEDVEILAATAFSKSDPSRYFHFKDLVHGYKTPDGISIGEPVLGRGGFMLKGLSALQPATGQGKTAPSHTVGAQVVEIELDMLDYTYRIITASTVMDIGALINPQLTTGMVKGGMAMGLSLASREAFKYNADGVMDTPNLRSYKLLHIGEEPDYRVDFVTTPQLDSPCGARSYSEHGILAIPAALANAISTALGAEIDTLPIKAENLWQAAGGII